MWLTWYQVVDHVCYSHSNTANGMCSINDSLNTKVSIHPSLRHIDLERNPHHPSSTLINPSLRSIHPRTSYPKTTSTRYDATSSSHNTRSIGTYYNMYLIYLPIRSRLSTWLQDDSSSESSTPCNFLFYEPIIGPRGLIWTATLLSDLLVPIPIPSHYIVSKTKQDCKWRRSPIKYM